MRTRQHSFSLGAPWSSSVLACCVLRTQARTTLVELVGRVGRGIGCESATVLPALSDASISPLMLVGIREPKVMVSHLAATVLSSDREQMAPSVTSSAICALGTI